MSTNLQPAQKKEATLAQWVRQPEIRNEIAAAVGDMMNPETFIQHALVAFQDPEVRECSPRSQLTALYEMAALCLLPTLNQAKLVRYNCKVKARDGSEYKELQIKLMPQWQGLKAIMLRHPAVLDVTPVLVHVKDIFSFVDGAVRHALDPFDAMRTITGPKDIRGGYTHIVYRDGRPPTYHFTTVAYIEKCRACAKQDYIWKDWYELMATKTLLRDTYARRAVPVDPLVSARMEKALSAEDAILGNDPIRIAAQPSGNDRLRKALQKPQEDTDAGSTQDTSPEPEAATGPPEAPPAENAGNDDQGDGVRGDGADAAEPDDVSGAEPPDEETRPDLPGYKSAILKSWTEDEIDGLLVEAQDFLTAEELEDLRKTAGKRKKMLKR